MSYQGYASYEEDISQTQQYDLENMQDQTYEQSSRLISIDALHDITNKIKISDAIKSSFPKSMYTEDQEESQENRCKLYLKNNNNDNKSNQNKMKEINYPLQMNKNKINQTIRRGNQSTKRNQSAKRNQVKRNILPTKNQINKDQNMLALKPQQKTRKKSLIYFQENQHHKQLSQSQLKSQTKSIQNFHCKTQRTPLKIKNNFQCQQNRIKKTQLNKQEQKQIKTCRTFKYFVDNPKQNQQKYKQNILTARSSNYKYNLAISDVFLQNMCKMYGNNQKQISLKERITLKIQKDSKNNRIKTLNSESHRYKRPQPSHNMYKPLNPLQTKQSTILSSQQFHNRQQKTLKNKKNKVQTLRKQQLQNQIKQCTFKPVTNININTGNKTPKYRNTLLINNNNKQNKIIYN